MPEGDTLYKAAATLSAMQGQTVTALASPLPAFADAIDMTPGMTISKVEARGKNLLMWFAPPSDDTDGTDTTDTTDATHATHAIYTHLRMSGSWHLYRPTTPWRKPERQARVTIQTAEWTAVCFNAPTVEWLTAWEVRKHPLLKNLGPDLLDPDASIDDMIARLRVNPERPLGEAIMDQRLVAGIGNVYKSELLFMQRLDPFAPVATYDDPTLRALLTEARKWMNRNLTPGRRKTRWGLGRRRGWVYGKERELCGKCNAVIQMRRQGDLGRSTYYCPVCQGVDTPRATESGPRRRGRGRVMVRGPVDD